MPRLRRLLPPRPPPGLLLARVQAGGLAGSAPAGSSRTGPRLPPPRPHRLPVRRVRHPLPWRAVVRRLRASLPRPRTRRLVRTLWRLAHPGRASRRGGPNVIAATDDRPPTANRSWLGISLIDSLKESDTPQLLVASTTRTAQGPLRRRRPQPAQQPALGLRPQERARRTAARTDPRRAHRRTGPGRLRRLHREDPGRPDRRPRLPGRRPTPRVHLPGPRPPQGTGLHRRPRTGHRRPGTPHARDQRPHRHRRRPLDHLRPARHAHSPDRPDPATPRLDRNPQERPAIEYNPVPPAEVQRDVTLPPNHLMPP